MGFPSFNRKNELTSNLLPEAEFDVSLDKTEHRVSSNQNDMIIARFVADNGSHQGGKVENMFVMGTPSEFGEKMLQHFANRARTADGKLDDGKDANGNVVYEGETGPTIDRAAAKLDDLGNPILVRPGGFVFTGDVNSWDEFAGQFVQNPPLRVRVKITHTYDVEKESGGWANNVDKKAFEAAKAQGRKAYAKAKMRVVGPPKSAPTLTVVAAGAAPVVAQQGYPGGDGASPVVANGAPVVAPAGGTVPF